MNAIVINKNRIILEVNKKELEILSSSLSEVCNTIEGWEFDTRMGIKIEEANEILDFLISSYCKLDKNQDF